MKKRKIIRALGYSAATAFTAVAVLSACSDDEVETGSDFNRTAVLVDAADRIIIPAYTGLGNSVENLRLATLEFIGSTDQASLDATREAWLQCYTDWQYASGFNFGPAGEQGTRKRLTEEIGTWPVDTAKIENAIATLSYNFNDFNRDARGFLAMEYLLFGNFGNDAELLEANAQNEVRREYLYNCVLNTQERINEVLQGWTSTYRSAFIADNGTAVGSSIALYYNEFVRSYEAIKNFKVGLPMGLRPGQVQAEPQLAEAYYSGQSLAMIAAHLDAVEKIWYGRDRNGMDGTGFEEYLASVTGGTALITATTEQLAAVKSALAAIPSEPDLAAQIISNPGPIEALHTELTLHTRFFKSDMSSLLGISITFSSGDGD